MIYDDKKLDPVPHPLQHIYPGMARGGGWEIGVIATDLAILSNQTPYEHVHTLAYMNHEVNSRWFMYASMWLV